MNKSFRGYIALISTLLLSAALTALVLGASTHVFQTRLKQLTVAYKLQSYSFAYSCIYAALQALATDSSYAPSQEYVWLTPADNCVINSIRVSADKLFFFTSATVHQVRTLLETQAVTNSKGGFSITSVTEITSIPP
jgi:hypothetical protein